MLAEKKCKICGDTGFRLLKKQSLFLGMNGRETAIIQCNKCGTVTRIPSLFEGADLQKLAPAQLRENTVFVGGDAEKPSAYFTRRLQFAASAVKGKKLLDIGCGTGSFLKLAQTLGWAVTGTEFTKATVDKLNSEGINCLHGNLENPALQGSQFDFIHLNHVFEHVEDPVALLRQAGALLAPGGMLLIEVPNEFNGLVQRIKCFAGFNGAGKTSFFEHEWFFSPQTLSATTRLAGLNPKKVFTPWQKSPGINPVLQLLYRFGAAMGSGANIEAHITKS
jgi:SAM-dependent methyltransferase